MRHKKKKRRTHVVDEIDPENPIPQSMVFRRGHVSAPVVQLTADLRRLMSPNTATRLRESKTNTLKDFISVAPSLHVTHFIITSQTQVGVNIRFTRIPHGPTLTFRVTNYSLMRDVVNAQSRPHSPASEYTHAPLVVLNNFNAAPISAPNTAAIAPSTDTVKLMAAVLQNMFPPIDVSTVTLRHCRRVVLFHFDPVTHLVDMRHYLITAQPHGLTRAVSKLLRSKLPDLSRYEDMSEYVESAQSFPASDSEVDDHAAHSVTLAQPYQGKGNTRNQLSAVRLRELGPRLTLSLLKIEEEVCGGRVLYHHYVKRTAEEEERVLSMKKQREVEREKRRREQADNVERKRKQAEAQKKASRRAARKDAEEDGDSDEENDERDVESGERSSKRARTDEAEDDDAAYYEAEVGHRPAPEVFGSSARADRSVRSSNAASPAADNASSDRRERSTERSEKKRTGGRRVGAVRKPWVRGRGGSDVGVGAGRGRDRRGGGNSSRGRSGSRGRGSR